MLPTTTPPEGVGVDPPAGQGRLAHPAQSRGSKVHQDPRARGPVTSPTAPTVPGATVTFPPCPLDAYPIHIHSGAVKVASQTNHSSAHSGKTTGDPGRMWRWNGRLSDVVAPRHPSNPAQRMPSLCVAANRSRRAGLGPGICWKGRGADRAPDKLIVYSFIPLREWPPPTQHEASCWSCSAAASPSPPPTPPRRTPTPTPPKS